METAIMSAMCRCCASEGVFKDVKSSYTWMGDEEVYADMLRECFDITLSTSDHCEDGGICEVCITQLRNASNFKKQVLHTEEQFKKHVNNKLFKPSIVKVEVSAEEDIDSDDNNMSAEEAYSGPEYEIPIKTETEEPKPKKRAAASKATTSRAKKAKTESGESSTKRRPLLTVKAKRDDVPVDSKNKESTPVSQDVSPEPKKATDLFKHKSNIKEILLWSNATPIRRIIDMGYMCCYCDDQYTDPKDLKKHTLETHQDVQTAYFFKRMCTNRFIIKLDITSLRCKICDQSMNTLDTLTEHLKVEHQKTIYSDIDNHIVPFEFSTETLQCCICSSKFDKFRMLLEHMNIHYRNYICNVCDTGFVNNSRLQAHMTIHSTGIFKCRHCGIIFDQLSKKKTHERIHSSSQNNCKCGYCNESFNDFRSKEAHLVEMHGLKVPTPKCKACDKVFTSRKSLNLHIRKDHLMERLHKCPECDLSFFSATKLRNHMATHTDVRSYECHVCSKTFRGPKALRQHLNLHDEAIQFKCDQCEKGFAHKGAWKIHMINKHWKKL